jgi:polyhydroxybutyrate depolymerase
MAVALVIATGAEGMPADAATKPASNTAVVHLELPGGARTYRLHRTPTRGGSQPLVVVLHGAGATAHEVERRYHWDALAAREGFVVAYPQGLGRRWDDTGTSDVDFVRAVIADASRRVAVDPDRVFVTGISNGGVMTYRAGCGLAGTVAAIGPVAAWFPACLPATPVSVIHIHGLEDGVLPFDGGGGSPSVPVGLSEWRAADGCTGSAAVMRSGQVTHSVWDACAPGTAVELFTIEHGRHEWPGAVPKPGNDPVSHALDATATIWAFFRAHPRPS